MTPNPYLPSSNHWSERQNGVLGARYTAIRDVRQGSDIRTRPLESSVDEELSIDAAVTGMLGMISQNDEAYSNSHTLMSSNIHP